MGRNIDIWLQKRHNQGDDGDNVCGFHLNSSAINACASATLLTDSVSTGERLALRIRLCQRGADKRTLRETSQEGYRARIRLTPSWAG